MCARHMILDQVPTQHGEGSGESDGHGDDPGDATAGDNGDCDDTGDSDDSDISLDSLWVCFLVLFCFVFEIGSHYVALADLKLAM